MACVREGYNSRSYRDLIWESGYVRDSNLLQVQLQWKTKRVHGSSAAHVSSGKWLHRTLLFTVFTTPPHGSYYVSFVFTQVNETLFRHMLSIIPNSYTTTATKPLKLRKNKKQVRTLTSVDTCLNVVNLLSDRWRNFQSFAALQLLVVCSFKQHGQCVSHTTHTHIKENIFFTCYISPIRSKLEY